MTSPEAVPTSFLVVLFDGADEERFAADLREAPSVFDVVDAPG